MKRFLTIFPEATNVHLIKDVGMIPYMLHKELQYESSLACYGNGNYEYLETEVKGLKLVYLKKIFNNHLLDVLFFLLLNAKKYDVLQVYHVLRPQLIWCFFFKVLSLGRGKTYLKLDADEGVLQYAPSKITKYFIKHITLITAENSFYVEELNKGGQFNRKIFEVPNGFYDDGRRFKISYETKVNQIITVGRIGTAQKATEVLCNAFAQVAESNNDWELIIIGPIEEHFKNFIITYFHKYPTLKQRVFFAGVIDSRRVLEEHYRRAKIFVLTSRYEGFPMVLPEAARFGCYIVATDLPASRQVTNGGKLGSVFPIADEQSLAKLLTTLCQNEGMLSSKCGSIQDFAYQHFYWPTICKKIDFLLGEK